MIIQGETNEPPSYASKVVIEHIDENKFKGFENHFKPKELEKETDNSVINNPKYEKLFHKEKDMFYCDKINDVNDQYCITESEFCTNCQRLNQEYHKLKKNYLINGAGRTCTYRKGKMFCLGEFQRYKRKSEMTKKEKNQGEIVFMLNLTCNGKIQCQPCQEMQKYMEKYYGTQLYNAIMKRDEKLGY